MNARSGFFFALFLLGVFPGRAGAMPRRTAHIDSALGPLSRGVPGGMSVGSPTNGHLVGGAHLEESPWLRVVPCYEGEDVRWGLDGLVSLIDHGARSVRRQFPDAVLSVGHLSRRAGGDVDRHASHESGRDADVGFYVTNERGKPIYADHFVRFLGDGTAPSWPGARFDDARNWAFVASIVLESRARVSYLFVASPLRTRLLNYAQRIGAPYAIRVRASEVMAQPRGSLPHDDHFHVRISCPSGMEQCIELPTRNIARARLLHPRQRTTQLATLRPRRAPASGVDRGPRWLPASPSERGVPARSADAPSPAVAPARLMPPVPELAPEPAPGEDLPATPAGSPPALLPDAPIDDVDGVEE